MSSLNNLTGDTLGQYKIIKPIGQGGMASVFLAHQPGLNRDVALKVLLPEIASRPGFSERFTREIQAIGNLHHPNILPVYDSGIDGKYSYLAMRYIPNATTLATRMKSQVSTKEAARLTQQVAAALDHAHQAGIIHRDVKPANILMDGDWILLSDFGLAKTVAASSDLTGTGTGLGTPLYMSPEQAKGEKVDHRTDIYALGIMLYEMLTGQVPHKAETPMGTVVKRISEPLPLPRTVNPDITPAVERVLLKALAANREQRYSSAGELAQALNEAIAEPVSQAETSRPVLETVASIQPIPPPVTITEAAPVTTSIQKSAGLNPIEVVVMTILVGISLCGIGGILLSLSDLSDATNVAMLSACLGLTFAGFSSTLLLWFRKRDTTASAWLAMGVLFWFLGVSLVGTGGFSMLSPSDMSYWENLMFTTLLCFGPGVIMAGGGLLAYGMDWRRGRVATVQQQGTAASSKNSTTADIDQKLAQAVEYRKHIDRLIKQHKDGPFANQMSDISTNMMQWENYLRQLVTRIHNFESNQLIQRDLVGVPDAVQRLQTQLTNEQNPQIQQEIREALDKYKLHQQQLNTLVTLIRRTELDIDETLATIGVIYSQLQLLEVKDIDNRQASRISANISEQSNRLVDLLSAMDDVYESTASFKV